MWRIWHWLFGWDYIAWANSCDSGIARVYRDLNPDAAPYYWRYRAVSVFDRITESGRVVWLTCAPSKYLDK